METCFGGFGQKEEHCSQQIQSQVASSRIRERDWDNGFSSPSTQPNGHGGSQTGGKGHGPPFPAG